MKMLKTKAMNITLQSQLREDIYLKWREHYGFTTGGTSIIK